MRPLVRSSEAFQRLGGVYFPAYRERPSDADRGFAWSVNPSLRGRQLPDDDPFGQFELGYLHHGSFAAEWPIRPDVGTATRGLRNTLRLSQVQFAERIGVSRVTVERWESGKIRPLRGDTLALLTLLRPLVVDALSAGQILNVVAAAVLPRLTRPAGTYTGADIFGMLRQRSHCHDDLGPALLSMLVVSEILVSLDGDDENDPSVRYIPLVGVAVLDRQPASRVDDIVAVGQRLTERDRRLWIEIGERLASNTDAGT